MRVPDQGPAVVPAVPRAGARWHGARRHHGRAFREQLVKANAIDKLFARFDAVLKDRGYLAMGGQIIDASVVPAPKQRNTEGEKAAIKEGRVPAAWKPVDLAIPMFGYKNHIGIARARIKIGMANLAYNFQRLIWLDGKAVPG